MKKDKNCNNKATLLADTILSRYSNPDNFPGKPWEYSQGYVLLGFIKLWEQTKNDRYRNYIMQYVDQHVKEDGTIIGFEGHSLDDMLPGTIIVWAYGQTGNIKYKKASDIIFKAFEVYPRNDLGGFWHAKWAPQQMWVDGLFMGPMFLSSYGKTIGNTSYCFEEIAKQYKLLYSLCRKGDSGLLLHGWSDDNEVLWADTNTGCSPEVWSEGLGWYAVALSEILENWPDICSKEREQMEDQYKQLLKSLIENQDEKTGLWYQVVDKKNTPDNWLDTSGSAMFTYSIAKACQLGYISYDSVKMIVNKAYSGLCSRIRENDDGLLDIYNACEGLCVQNDYNAYVHYPQKVNAREAVAACLWVCTYIEYNFKKLVRDL